MDRWLNQHWSWGACVRPISAISAQQVVELQSQIASDADTINRLSDTVARTKAETNQLRLAVDKGEKRLVEEQERVRSAETRVRAALATADSRVEMAVAAERNASQQIKEDMEQCVSAEKARTKEGQHAYDEAKDAIESLHEGRERQTRAISDLKSQIEVLEVSVRLAEKKLDDTRRNGETSHRWYEREHSERRRRVPPGRTRSAKRTTTRPRSSRSCARCASETRRPTISFVIVGSATSFSTSSRVAPGRSTGRRQRGLLTVPGREGGRPTEAGCRPS